MRSRRRREGPPFCEEAPGSPNGKRSGDKESLRVKEKINSIREKASERMLFCYNSFKIIRRKKCGLPQKNRMVYLSFRNIGGR